MASSVSLGKPTYHVVAQRGWMNDPCAPGRLPSGEYNLMYQWNPHSHIWDTISWGQVVSDDLVTWKYTTNEPVFVPDQPYDRLGIFTGCMVERPVTSKSSDQGVTIFYTSVPILPIHWSTPHPRGAEGVTMVTSKDGYKWEKRGMVVEQEPSHLFVTGFRDPTIMSWPAMDRSLNRTTPGLYALISGGLQEGPCLFLYSLDPDDISKWTFLRTIGNVSRSLQPSKWTGDFGTNWECAAIFTLEDAASGEKRDVMMWGVEGAGVRDHVQRHREDNPDEPLRDPRCYPWVFASVDEEKIDGNGVPDVKWKTSGLMDWADFYALSTRVLPDGRRIAWGWVVEQDLSKELAEEKGWTGCLGVPRELGLKVYDGVQGLVGGGPLRDVGSWEVKEGGRVITVGIEPMRELEKIRGSRLELPKSGEAVKTPMSGSYELHLSAALTSTSTITLNIRHTPDHSIGSRITFSPSSEQIIIHRGKSSTYSGVNKQDEVAPFDLLSYKDGTKETLDWRVFVDEDVVELSCNGRVAMSTRIYAPAEAGLVSVQVEGEGKILGLEMWEMGNIGLVQ